MSPCFAPSMSLKADLKSMSGRLPEAPAPAPSFLAASADSSVSVTAYPAWWCPTPPLPPLPPPAPLAVTPSPYPLLASRVKSESALSERTAELTADAEEEELL